MAQAKADALRTNLLGSNLQSMMKNGGGQQTMPAAAGNPFAKLFGGLGNTQGGNTTAKGFSGLGKTTGPIDAGMMA